MTDDDLQKNQDEFGHPGGLIGALLQQSLDDAHESSRRLHEYEKERANKAEAELAAIRWRIRVLFEGPYQPSSSAVLSELWPSEDTVNDYRERDMF